MKNKKKEKPLIFLKFHFSDDIQEKLNSTHLLLCLGKICLNKSQKLNIFYVYLKHNNATKPEKKKGVSDRT